jgi:hypothetical protein
MTAEQYEEAINSARKLMRLAHDLNIEPIQLMLRVVSLPTARELLGELARKERPNIGTHAEQEKLLDEMLAALSVTVFYVTELRKLTPDIFTIS